MGRPIPVRDDRGGPEADDAPDRCELLDVLPSASSRQMALVEDPKFKVWVEKYAADQELFFKDFAMAFAKLIGE